EDHPGLEARSARRHGSRLAPTVRRLRCVSDRGLGRLPIQLFWIAPPIAQSAEAVDLKSIQCGFESHWGDHRHRLSPAANAHGCSAIMLTSFDKAIPSTVFAC